MRHIIQRPWRNLPSNTGTSSLDQQKRMHPIQTPSTSGSPCVCVCVCVLFGPRIRVHESRCSKYTRLKKYRSVCIQYVFHLLSRKLTWNLKKAPWKRRNIYKPPIVLVPCWLGVVSVCHHYVIRVYPEKMSDSCWRKRSKFIRRIKWIDSLCVWHQQKRPMKSRMSTISMRIDRSMSWST